MASLSQRALLHHGGTPATWGNLGLWPAPDYAAACAALARRVGQAAALAPGQRVLSMACGAGDELALWTQAFGVAHALGSERDPQARALAARFEGPSLTVTGGDVWPAGPFDAVVCVDAAYHLSPRAAFIAQAHMALADGGRLAFTDLVFDGRRSLPLRAAARVCGLPVADLGAADRRIALLRAAGFVDVQCERLEAAVLDGFVAFVRAQRPRLGTLASGPGWRRVAVTAALIPPCRALGLGYALFSARRRRGRP